MKKIVLKVEVPDDYVLDDPSWLMEDTSGFDVECI
jgi:hypothetical protein